MKRVMINRLSAAFALGLLGVSGLYAQSEEASPVAEPVRNVILVIGDGMDDHQITIARNYLAGARGRITLDDMPVRSAVQVLTVNESAPDTPVYVADSANSATSMATGVVTSRGRIATTAGTDRDIPTIAEQAKAAGMKVGIIATSSVTDATPASFISHISKRWCENSTLMVEADYHGRMTIDCSLDTKANGGAGSIAEQIADSPYDIVLGGGAEHFRLPTEAGDQTVMELARSNGFYVIESADELKRLPRDQKVLGLFSDDTMPVRWRGENDRSAEEVERSWLNQVIAYMGSVELPEPIACEANPGFAGQPHLRDLMRAALDHLYGEQGFFLMLESASIDKQSHNRNACGQIGELEQLLEALDVALKFAEENPPTLVLVTADHGQAAQMIPAESLFAAMGLPGATPGRVARLETPEGPIMSVNYATNNLIAEEHTGVNVPIFGNNQAEGLFGTLITQPDIYHIMADFLGLPAR